jgi:hypothetical protein
MELDGKLNRYLFEFLAKGRHVSYGCNSRNRRAGYHAFEHYFSSGGIPGAETRDAREHLDALTTGKPEVFAPQKYADCLKIEGDVNLGEGLPSVAKEEQDKGNLDGKLDDEAHTDPHKDPARAMTLDNRGFFGSLCLFKSPEGRNCFELAFAPLQRPNRLLR